MKTEYLEKLKNTFIEKGINETDYNEILQKYDTWYDTLLSENKTEDEIYEILKQPEEVVNVFIEQLNLGEKTDEQTSKIVLEKEIVAEQTKVEEQVKPEPMEQQVQQTETNNQTSSEKTNTNQGQTTTDDGLIIRTNAKGKEFHYRKRTFGGIVGMFFTFLLVSMFVLPLLTTLFTSTLASSFVCMTVFFLPVYYIAFTFSNGAIPYINEDALVRIQNEVFSTSGNTEVFGISVVDVNNLIAKVNEFTDFSFMAFLQTLLISLFSFALAVLFLFASLQLMRIMLSYFVGFFHSIYYVRVK